MTIKASGLSIIKSAAPNRFVPKFALVWDVGGIDRLDTGGAVKQACQAPETDTIKTICSQKDTVLANARKLQDVYKNVAEKNYDKLDASKPRQSLLEKLNDPEQRAKLDLDGRSAEELLPLAQEKSKDEKTWFDSNILSFINFLTGSRDAYVSKEGFGKDVETSLENIDGSFSQLNDFIWSKIQNENFRIYVERTRKELAEEQSQSLYVYETGKNLDNLESYMQERAVGFAEQEKKIEAANPSIRFGE